MLEFKINTINSKFRTEKKNPKDIPPKPKVSGIFCIISLPE